MLRDPALIPLSQQHHNGLALCVLTERALGSDRSDAAVSRLARRVIDRYEIELTNHFGIEEQVLFPLIEREIGAMAIVNELIADHRSLEKLVDQLRVAPSAELLQSFCDLLRGHIRREENELFQDIQQRLPKDALEAAGKEIDARAIRVCL
jgi:hemerythrin-like domain-containing protein